MSDESSPLNQAYLAVLEELSGHRGRRDWTDYIAIADRFRRSGYSSWALRILEQIEAACKNDVNYWYITSLSARDAQDYQKAYVAIRRAVKRAPSRPDILAIHALISYETWRPAASHYKEALRYNPESLDLLKNQALALVAEQNASEAIELLESKLAEQPSWVEGHRQLASINATTNQPLIDRSFGLATGKDPMNASIWLAWFNLLFQAHDWERASAVLRSAPSELRGTLNFKIAHVLLGGETGANLESDDTFCNFPVGKETSLDLCRVRYFLKRGLPHKAEQIAENYIGTNNQRLFWPYLSLCWRLVGDPRHAWLNDESSFIKSVDLDLESKHLIRLSKLLRQLHGLDLPYIEQSVRGGTQTDRNLFFHPDQLIQNLRRLAQTKIKEFAEQLPSTNDTNHPLLSIRPAEFAFSGAWSVRLRPNGYHTSHTHVLGWVSSALYVDVPKHNDLGPPPSGYLSFGKPPPELGLDLPATCEIEPKAGRLVLFPSYMWHGTEPFSDGERLSVAFDVVPR